MDYQQLIADIHAAGKPADVPVLQRFFKTAAGQYGAGDIFIGVKMPILRQIVRPYRRLSIAQLEKLLTDPVHEIRMAGIIVMTMQAKDKRATGQARRALYDLYLHSPGVNNWDLVDVGCRDIIGYYLVDKPRDELYAMAVSPNLWQRRIAMVSTFAFLQQGQSRDTYAIAELLLHDPHDLIQKAVGWLLREAGKRVSRQELVLFLEEHAATMPRTALRYAIEHLDEPEKAHFMKLRYNQTL